MARSTVPRRRSRREEYAGSDEAHSDSSALESQSKRPRLSTAEAESDRGAISEEDDDAAEESGVPTNSPLDKVHAPRQMAHRGIGPGGYKPGAIVRIKVTNFVTYTSAEFHPGPKLNMVIGPNGTGKSTLVCAICLGLGWGPQVL